MYLGLGHDTVVNTRYLYNNRYCFILSFSHILYQKVVEA